MIRLCDDYYGTIHFVAVIAVLLLLFFRFPERYRLWRNTLALTTGLALIGFSFFPLLLLGCCPSGYHFVDTLKVIGGVWNFSSGPVNNVSNQYAAMPSLHTSWSAWCTLAVVPAHPDRGGPRRWWCCTRQPPSSPSSSRPITTLPTSSRGLLLLGASYLLALTVTVRVDRWYADRRAAAVSVPELTNGARQ